MDQESRKSRSEDAGNTAANESLTPRSPARTALPAREDGRGAGSSEDAPSSNTASSSYKNENNKNEIKILLKGIDSLYFSVPGEIDPVISQELADRKLFAQSKKAKDQARAIWSVGEHRFQVSDKGQGSGSGGGFAYVLEDGAYRICLSASWSRSMPMAYIKVSSAYLAHQRPEAIYREILGIVGSFGSAESPCLSRVDIFVDFQSDWDMETFSRRAWVTRAGGFDTHARSGEFTGYSIGLGGNISSRLYNKTQEIKKSRKSYFDVLWQRGGLDPLRPIWRQEFEIHREVLNELRILSFDHLLDRLGSIWAYATQTWLRLTIPQESDSNRARWPMHPLWQALSEVRWRLDDEPLIRRFSPTRLPEEARLCRFLLSYITSFMAMKRIRDFDSGARQALEMARNTQAVRCEKFLGITFDDWIEQEVAVKAKKFNLPFGGDVSAREEVDRPLAVEREADEYYRASRGE